MVEGHEQEVKSRSDRDRWSRRRFAKAGLLGVPLVMTLHSRPVLGAYQCTVSGMMSGNLSNFDPAVSECMSLAEGDWLNAGQWPGGFARNTGFHDVFGLGPYDYGSASFNQVIQNPSFSDDNDVGFAAIGALLNAAQFGEAFGYDPQWVIDTWQNWTGGTLDLAEFFSALNARWADTTTL